ncbi:MAG: NADH-quinone oxidoreductase subunit C [Gammaproteobacteria bacterium]|nr:NADH-quinone oxidoreductase subunit C [Gammaproteobacteria bacterium]
MDKLIQNLNKRLGSAITSCTVALDEITIEVQKNRLLEVCKTLRDDDAFRFEQLIDLCGIDYLGYGDTEWSTEKATEKGFSRGRIKDKNAQHLWSKPRFGVVYHLISYKNNQRLRVRVFVDEANLFIDSVIGIWNCANWFEREAFDMFGIVFVGHPDLRRLLTDYGFIGHPLRKDFPVFGHVEMRYDEEKKRVVYEPVDIEPRVLVPRVIRDDFRYIEKESAEA